MSRTSADGRIDVPDAKGRGVFDKWGTAGQIFGSMANLVDIVESERTLERFT
jgi:hypothetical protein